MKRTWMIIGVGDVQASLKWYQALFGQPTTLRAQITFGKSSIQMELSCSYLHQWGAHEHPFEETQSRNAGQRAPVVLPCR
jgi:hypothetical protein